MTKFGEIYSQYYDLLYKDKDYSGEVDYVDSLIKRQLPEAKNLLDLGCGTGRHAEVFCDKGYVVHGVDLSESMLEKAKERSNGKEDRLSFSHSDVTKLCLDKKFDAIVALFHVVSYQLSNESLEKTFEAVSRHLNDGGVFLFDFWYGPAVLTELPSTRIKRLEDEHLKVIRIAEPEIHCQKNVVDVNYEIFIKTKKTSELTERKELHQMRFLFDTEIEMVCKKAGLNIMEKCKWMSDSQPDLNSWNAVWIVKK